MSEAMGTQSVGEGNAIAAIVAIAIAVVSVGVAYGVWTIRKTIKTSSAQKRRRILYRSPSTCAPETASLELGHMFTKSVSCEPEPFVFPYFRPHNLAAYLPPASSLAYIGGNAPFPPPGLPICRILDAVRIPVVVANPARHLRGVQVVFGHAGDFQCQTESQSLDQPTPPLMTSNADEVDKNWNVANVAALPLSVTGLGLTIDSIRVDAGYKTVDHVVLTAATERNNFNGGLVLREGVTVNKTTGFLSVAESAPSQLMLSPVAPALPTLVITSASIERGLVAKRGKLDTISQLPSPPLTPTLVITFPSIHCGLEHIKAGYSGSTYYDDNLENWSDVLGLEEYQDEDYFSLGNTCSKTSEQLPSPSQTPTFRSTTPSLPCMEPSVTSRDRHELNHGEGSRKVEYTLNDEDARADIVGEPQGPPFDHAAFHASLAAFMHAKDDKDLTNSAHTRTAEDSVAPSSKATVAEDASQAPDPGMGFDYQRLHALRAASLLVKS